jgi:hypothetical protein
MITVILSIFQASRSIDINRSQSELQGDSKAGNASPLIAASATFALNAALCLFRVRFMSCSRALRAF